jgi:hypothetical protein
MIALSIKMNSLAYEAVERGYTSKEARDQRDVNKYDRFWPFWALDSNFDAAKRFYLILSFT